MPGGDSTSQLCLLTANKAEAVHGQKGFRHACIRTPRPHLQLVASDSRSALTNTPEGSKKTLPAWQPDQTSPDTDTTPKERSRVFCFVLFFKELFIYICKHSICMYTYMIEQSIRQKGAPDSIMDSCDPSCGCWEYERRTSG